MNNVDIYKLATDYMAMREKFSLSGDSAAKAKAAGVEKFADLFSDSFRSSDQQNKSLRWIQEYEEHLRYLIENDGAPEEIEGTTNIIQQLRLQKVERAMYEALGLNDNDDRADRNRSSFDSLLANTELSPFADKESANGLYGLLTLQSF